jgi:vancomycin aglycone glucosyltransferase
MRALLSTIGTRGDVQPLIALAVALREAGHRARFCVPPDFRSTIVGLGFDITTVGPSVRPPPDARVGSAPVAPTAADRERLARDTVDAQFDALLPASSDCDVIVAATALQIAAHSVAELRGIPYVYVAYAPCVLPSRFHAPPVLPGDAAAASSTEDHATRWKRDARRFHSLFGTALNARRRALGLAAVESVREHVFGSGAWLAADPALAPWPESDSSSVLQTGVWRLPDTAPLGAALEAFLDDGPPPVYVGFGSARVNPGLAQGLIDAARVRDRRVIVSRGWSALSLDAGGRDILVVDEVNHDALFPRVAAVVHHGGAGTTSAAALAGTPQLVLPHVYDQFYWAERVSALGIGAVQSAPAATANSLADPLGRALAPEVAAHAAALAPSIRRDGARAAARRLCELVRAGGAGR